MINSISVIFYIAISACICMYDRYLGLACALYISHAVYIQFEKHKSMKKNNEDFEVLLNELMGVEPKKDARVLSMVKEVDNDETDS